MLSHLFIQNYALIQALEMQPHPGLNMITGETGAGKSIMLGAVGLLMGKRADTKVLYDEDTKCIIEGKFDISRYQLQSYFEKEDLDYEPLSTIRREINSKGKSRAFINDSPVTLDVLKGLGEQLMDVHSQHETLLLGESDYQLQFIDAFAGNKLEKENYEKAYYKYKELEKELRKLQSDAANIKQDEDYNRFLFEELEKARLEELNQEHLEQELKKLENAEAIKMKLAQCSQLLQNSDFSVLSNLSEVDLALKSIKDFDQKLADFHQRNASVIIELKDLLNEVEREEELIEFDPEKSALVQEQLSTLFRLQQKHKVQEVEELIAIRKRLDEQLNKTLSLDEDIQKLEQAYEDRRQDLSSKASDLSHNRQAVFEPLCNALITLLQDLGMPNARVEIFQECKDYEEDGSDQIQFAFSANKGIPPQPISQVASGGEFSRLMFCIKYILASKKSMATLLFDEIDTGISGEVALKMIQMMKKMAEKHQIIAISHLPQFAAKGDAHYFVYKDESAEKSISKVRKLEEAERVDAIAKMLAGERPTEAAFQNAREMMGI